MNTIHTSLFASFTPAMYSGNAASGTEGIDSLIQSIHSDWQKVTEVAASGKKAYFAIKSYRGTYETALNQQENSRRRTVINKQRALACNYQATDYAFRFFGQRLMANIRSLAARMPDLIKDSKASAGDSSINDACRVNTVVCARIITDMPETLRALAAEFAQEVIMHTAFGAGDLISINSSLFDHGQSERLAAPLNIAYHFGISDDAVFVTFEESLMKMAATLERAEQVALAFERGRSLAHNQEQFQSRLASVTTTDQARLLVKEADTALVDYRAASVALDKAVSAVFYACENCEEQLKALPRGHGQSSTGLWGLLQANRVAAKCLIENARSRRTKMKALIIGSDNHDLKQTSYQTLEAAFHTIPSTFQFPYLDCLHCS